MNAEVTAEQQARDMLERLGVDGAQEFTSGDLVELANLIANEKSLKFFSDEGSATRIDHVLHLTEALVRDPAALGKLVSSFKPEGWKAGDVFIVRIVKGSGG